MPLNRLRALTENDYGRIHDASVRILEETGVVFHSEEALAVFRNHGARVAGETVFITGAMLENALKTCPRSFPWRARNEKYNVMVGDDDVFLVQPAVGPAFIQDEEQGRRKARLEDYANVMKICQACDTVHLTGTIPIDPGDAPSEYKHLHMMLEALRHTDKPLIGYCFEGSKVLQNFEMMDMVMGGGDWLKEHWLGVLVNPLSPLGYARETLETIIEYTRRNQIILLAPCMMAGVSGPVSLMGTAVLQNVEILAGLVLIQLLNPGTPVVYATASTTGYMKTASFAGGAPEAMLINLPNIQMAMEYYNLPTRTMCGINHAKSLDCQAGYETMMSLMMGVFSGAHIGVQCFGTLDAVMTLSYEKMMIDDEIISRVLRLKEGLRPANMDLSVDVIQQVGPGGNFLTHPSTFKQFRSFWTPTVSDWNSYDVWQKAGETDAVARASKKYKEILASARDSLLSNDLEKDLVSYVKKASGE